MTRALMSYHPRYGHLYTLGLKMRAPGRKGDYLVRVNDAGFRSDREFCAEKQPGVFRVLLFGDSQGAGDGVSNADRFSDQLEKAIPGLEVYNDCLSGSGPDQQYLIYEDNRAIDHDLVIIAVYLDAIDRTSSPIRKFLDEQDNEVFYAKPFFWIEKGALKLHNALHNAPPAKRPWTEETLPVAYRPYIPRRWKATFATKAAGTIVRWNS